MEGVLVERVWPFLPGTLDIGIGMAAMLGPANAAVLRDVPGHQLGAANAAYNMVRTAGGALGVAITAAIIGDTAEGERLDAFRAGWWVMVAIMGVCKPADPGVPVPRRPGSVDTATEERGELIGCRGTLAHRVLGSEVRTLGTPAALRDRRLGAFEERGKQLVVCRGIDLVVEGCSASVDFGENRFG